MEVGVAPAAAFLVFKQIHSSVISASPKIAWLQWIFSANHSNKYPENLWALSLQSYLNKVTEKMCFKYMLLLCQKVQVLLYYRHLKPSTWNYKL